MDIEVIGDLLNTQVIFIVMRLNHMLAGQIELIGGRWMAPMDIRGATSLIR